ncbi:box C/D snoRNA protein 1 [Chrysoperla carnea]|uniref:box C/D snoRNA protein 1 n=1 Tax=Chrysoperla carnea TaxID=189513 RepID=UPI001D097EE4|nr:box C/D snoRNA protein 1 [Chrysoperla carnea]
MDDENIMDVDYPFNDRLGPCEVCGLKESIYTCPKCEVKTCCLKCVRIHKKELSCDGVRDKTKFIRMNNFSNLDLLSDYRLLEQASRTVERCKRNPNTCFKNRGTQNQTEHLPLHLYRLNAACIRRNTSLKFLPKEFTRRKSNTTYLDWKTQTIYWKIEWIFPLDDGNLKLIDDKCSENDTFGLVLQKYFTEIENYKRLEYYQSKGINGVCLLLKAEQKRGGKSFYELELTNCIKDSFKYKIIIENPTIYVIFKEHLSLYNLIDADEERETLLKESTTADPIKDETDKNENIMSNILNVKNSKTDDSIEVKIPKRMFKIEETV